MANRTMEDWFLRGGEKPPRGNGMQAYVCGPTIAMAVCQNCGGENLADETECTHCGASLVGEPSTAEYCGADDGDEYESEGDEREFTVTVRRTWTVRQEAKMKVRADCADAAMMIAEDEAETAEADWEIVPDTDEYEDCEAISAEES